MLPLALAIFVLFVGYLFFGWTKSSYPGWLFVVLVGAIVFALIGRRASKERS